MSVIQDFFCNQPLREYSKGQILLYQAEQTNSVFYIQKGFVKVYDITSEGNEKLLLILGEGDIYPVIWTFRASDTLLYFYEAHTDIEVRVADRKDFAKHIDASHDFTKALLRHFVERIKDLSLRVECLEASNAKNKIAQVLQYLVTTHPGSKKGAFNEIKVPLTHQIIANMAGLSRETTSTIIKELEDKKVLKQESAFMLISERKLEEKSEE